MPLTPEQHAKVDDWAGRGGAGKCVCGSEHWTVADDIYVLQAANSATKGIDYALPVASMGALVTICHDCGRVVMHNAATLGLV